VRKKTIYLQFYMETPGGHQKSIFSTSKVEKKPKIDMGSIRRNSNKREVSRLKRKKVMRITIFADIQRSDGIPFYLSKITFLSRKSPNSSRT
jgi:hypothetical protein